MRVDEWTLPSHRSQCSYPTILEVETREVYLHRGQRGSLTNSPTSQIPPTLFLGKPLVAIGQPRDVQTSPVPRLLPPSEVFPAPVPIVFNHKDGSESRAREWHSPGPRAGPEPGWA